MAEWIYFIHPPREDFAATMTPEEQEVWGVHFERFERAVSARQYGGMGVGLFIVDRIVRAHQGRIEVSSEPGKGATFMVHLPLGDVSQPLDRRPELEAQPEA